METPRLSLLCLLALACLLVSAADERFQVVVVSGSSGGFGAALAAGRMGMKVALIEDTPVLGGMLSNGISNIDAYSYESLSGIFEEFRAGVRAHYAPIAATDPVFGMKESRPIHLDGRGKQSNNPSMGGRWEPHVADLICKSLLACVPSVKVFYNTRATGVLRQGNRVTGVTVENQRGESARIYGDIIIDATHEADIAAWAGVPYRVGREARTPEEPHAGDIVYFNGTGEILEPGTGRQDVAVVSYGLRLSIHFFDPAAGPAHMLQSPPPGYNAADYQHSPGLDRRPSQPGGNTEMNVNPVGNEMQEVNWSWPDATPTERRKLYELYRNHALGYLYYLQHEQGRTDIGLPPGEFIDNGHVPYRVFVREARRIEGEATMTEADINPFLRGSGLLPPLRTDAIAIGHYPIDSKPVRRKTDVSTPDKGNGDFFLVNASSAFQVPYGAIVPKSIDGLLVPVALSATHVAFSAVRMDPTWMVLGQAAGTAAALAIRDRIEPRALPIGRLQRELIRQRVKLLFYWDLAADHPAFAAIEWLSAQRIATGYPDRLFRPDQPLTRAEASTLLVRAWRIWPSVSTNHFTDVPYTHWAFRDVETLYDHRALAPFGVTPRSKQVGAYVPGKHAGFDQSHLFAEFAPERAVTWSEFTELVAGLEGSTGDRMRAALGASEFGASYAKMEIQPERPITRGEACALVAAVRDGCCYRKN